MSTTALLHKRDSERNYPSPGRSYATVATGTLAMGDQWEFAGPTDIDDPILVKVAPRMRTNSGDTCAAAALQHMGIVLQPSFLVGKHLASGVNSPGFQGGRLV